MPGGLDGKRVAVFATDGVDQVELDQPWQTLVDAGARLQLVGLAAGTITAYDHIDRGDTRTVDVVVADADPASFDALSAFGKTIVEQFAAG
jgi:deglycase